MKTEYRDVIPTDSAIRTSFQSIQLCWVLAGVMITGFKLVGRLGTVLVPPSRPCILLTITSSDIVNGTVSSV